jgi:uncharacterized protein
VKIFLLGATGNAGQRILRAALARAHEVTAMVRDEPKLPSSPNLRVTRGIVDKSLDLARVMAGGQGARPRHAADRARPRR